MLEHWNANMGQCFQADCSDMAEHVTPAYGRLIAVAGALATPAPLRSPDDPWRLEVLRASARPARPEGAHRRPGRAARGGGGGGGRRRRRPAPRMARDRGGGPLVHRRDAIPPTSATLRTSRG